MKEQASNRGYGLLVQAMLIFGGLTIQASGEDPAATAPTPTVQSEEITPAVRQSRPKPTPQQQTPIDDLIPVTTKSGLTYYDIRVGKGSSATPVSRVSINYVCWLPDGTTFDSSAKLSKPATVRLHKPEIIEGWKEGIGSMREGGVRRLEVPWQIGYGENGKAPVGPKQDLIFEIELLRVHQDSEALPADRMVTNTQGEPVDPDAPAEVPPGELPEVPVTTTESGLKVMDLVVGEGPTPAADSEVTIRYSGWIKNGPRFVSSDSQDGTSTFVLKASLKGMVEGISSMKVGGKRRLELPPELGYGNAVKGSPVPPNSTIVFEIELLAVK